MNLVQLVASCALMTPISVQHEANLSRAVERTIEVPVGDNTNPISDEQADLTDRFPTQESTNAWLL